jgi:hypothetical protein
MACFKPKAVWVVMAAMGLGISWLFSCLKDKQTVDVFLLAENIILVQVTKASTYVRSCLFSEWLLK